MALLCLCQVHRQVMIIPPTQGGNSISPNIPATSREQVFTGRNIVTQTTNQNANTMIFGAYMRPVLVYMLPPG